MKLLPYVAIYLAIGFLFDANLFNKNAPGGVKYAPTPRFIAGWPYYFFVSRRLASRRVDPNSFIHG